MPLWTAVGAGSQLLHRGVHGLSTSATIQAALDGDDTDNVPVVVASGADIPSSGIDIDGGAAAGGLGGMMYGHGASELLGFSSAAHKNASRIVYDGARGGSEYLLKYERSRFYLGHMNVSGMTRAQFDGGVTAKCARGIFINRSALAGVGTGGLTVQNVNFDGFETCVDVGDTLDEDNCDTSDFYSCHFNSSTRCFRFNNEAALGYNLFNPHIGNSGIGTVGTVWDIYAGGRFNSYGGLMASPCTFAQFRNDNPEASWGQNAAGYSIDGLHLDDGGLGLARLVNMEQAGPLYYAKIAIDKVICGSVAQTVPLIHLSGRTECTITNCSGLQAGCITFDTSQAGAFCKVSVENSALSLTTAGITDLRDLVDESASFGTLQFAARNCGYPHAAWLAEQAPTTITGTG